MSEVTLRNVVKTYGTNSVIHGIDLAIESGEFVVFVGPSGCGRGRMRPTRDASLRAMIEGGRQAEI